MLAVKTVWNYRDIWQRPHPVSIKHTPMPRQDRAAQFAPFSALTGYKEALELACIPNPKF